MYKTVVVLVVLFLTENETYISSVASESFKDMKSCEVRLNEIELDIRRDVAKNKWNAVERYSPKEMLVQDAEKQLQKYECLESWIIE
tara:strand:+ start:136 stop:396 length:261 start_codon:yes stop_codon:yes gene_type:complete